MKRIPRIHLPSVLNELRRRKVVRVLAAYVVTAAAVIGVASAALPALNAEPWVLTAITRSHRFEILAD